MPDCHAIVFAGGVGQRLWPLSRKNTPKQFAPLLGTRSSIQLGVDRLLKRVAPESLFVFANQRFAEILRNQLPQIPASHFVLEPARRDVGAAVALAFFRLERLGIRGPVIFQWSDSYVKNDAALLDAFDAGIELLAEDGERLVIIGEQPRSANDNLGWIELASEQRSGSIEYHHYDSWSYRPDPKICAEMFASGRYAWNAGFFVSSVEFMTAAYRKLAPELSGLMETIVQSVGTPEEEETLNRLYPTAPKLHFDEAILMRVPREQAVVVRADLGWCDPGNLASLKEALEAAPQETVIRGDVVALETRDCFIYNGSTKPVVALGLEEIILVDLPDVTLAIHKHAVRNLGTLLEELEKRGRGELL